MSICSLINLIIIIRPISDNSHLWESNEATYINYVHCLLDLKLLESIISLNLRISHSLFSLWIYLIQWKECMLNFKTALSGFKTMNIKSVQPRTIGKELCCLFGSNPKCNVLIEKKKYANFLSLILFYWNIFFSWQS